MTNTYHMFLTFVPGIFTNWAHPREIVHLTSKDGIKWNTVGRVDLKSDKVIDACVIRLSDGRWRMWYKDERNPKPLCYADSPDLQNWIPRGNAVTNFTGEGPKVFRWKGKYWLIADCWRNGMRVWNSDDCTDWKMQDAVLFGNHGDAVVSGDRAWWFYFAGPHDLPGSRRTAINVAEFSMVNGELIADAYAPAYVRLEPAREEEW